MEKHTVQKEEKNYRLGLASGILCAFLWGILPLYWHTLAAINSTVIIFYRILLVSIVCLLASLKVYGVKATFEPVYDKKLVFKLIIAGFTITLNWSIYIWAVNAGHIIQASIGYYIQPLVVSLFGIILFKERLTEYRTISFAFAAASVALLLSHLGEIPMVSISLAVTFAFYAAVKKSLNTPAILSLLWETIFLAPFALAAIIRLECSGRGALASSEPFQYGLLLLSGFVTAIPLALFSVAANNLPLITLGLTEYVSPSLTLLIGIYIFKEPFDMVQFIACCIIWVGLVIFMIGERKLLKGED